MLPIILYLEKLAGKVIFIDEPEAGISLSNQQKILETLLKAAKKCQIVVTTHSYPIIKEAGEVFSLDHKKWMPSKKYLEHIKII
jgi:predicted ATPase